ncbi:MFS transporter [Aeromicrobium sp. P5_D10]
MRGHGVLVATLMMIVAMPALDIAVVVLVLPVAASAESGGGYGIALTVYLLGLLATTPLWGVLSDRYGPRPLLLAGTLVFAVGALGSAFLPGVWLLIASRAVQGIGAGSMQSLTQAVVASRISDISGRGRAFALLSSSWGGAALIAPVVVSFIPLHSWRLVFLVTLPLAAAVLVVFPRVYPRDQPVKREALDVYGCTLLLAASACVAVMVAEPQNLIGLVAAALFAGVVVVLLAVEKRARHPVLPRTLFQRPGFSAALLAAVVLGFVLTVTSVAAPMYTQLVLGASPGESGVVYAALCAAWTVSALATAPLLRRTGIRRTGRLGAATIAGGYALLILSVVLDGNLWLNAAAAFVVGAGLGPLANAVVISTQQLAGARRVGTASSLGMMSRSLGQSMAVVAVAFAVVVAERWTSADSTAVLRGVLISYSLALVAALGTWFLIGGITRPRRPTPVATGADIDGRTAARSSTGGR